jgi:hypothetical protein
MDGGPPTQFIDQAQHRLVTMMLVWHAGKLSLVTNRLHHPRMAMPGVGQPIPQVKPSNRPSGRCKNFRTLRDEIEDAPNRDMCKALRIGIGHDHRHSGF